MGGGRGAGIDSIGDIVTGDVRGALEVSTGDACPAGKQAIPRDLRQSGLGGGPVMGDLADPGGCDALLSVRDGWREQQTGGGGGGGGRSYDGEEAPRSNQTQPPVGHFIMGWMNGILTRPCRMGGPAGGRWAGLAHVNAGVATLAASAIHTQTHNSPQYRKSRADSQRDFLPFSTFSELLIL